jgi:NADP-dependent 3-hydroxy acid dehydrogenase YdfG
MAMNGNKIALVTGAGSGIGRGASVGLQATGFSVVNMPLLGRG